MAASPWYTNLRALDQWRFRHDPVLRRSMSQASVILGAAPYVRAVLAGVPLRRFEVMSELGVEQLPEAVERGQRPPGELRGLYVGRLVRSKGARDAIRALAKLDDQPGITLDIVGDGDDREACEAEAKGLNLGERVRFHGWLSKAEVAERYRSADAFIFPSFREPTGRVLVEAMSYGLPVVAADYGGPAAIIDPEVGVLVLCVDPEQFSAEIARAVGALAADPQARARLGEAGRGRILERYLWPAKIAALEQIYSEVLSAAPPGG
jgi:glycosyltransferase involved in cell wall biosynthesis